MKLYPSWGGLAGPGGRCLLSLRLRQLCPGGPGGPKPLSGERPTAIKTLVAGGQPVPPLQASSSPRQGTEVLMFRSPLSPGQEEGQQGPPGGESSGKVNSWRQGPQALPLRGASDCDSHFPWLGEAGAPAWEPDQCQTQSPAPSASRRLQGRVGALPGSTGHLAATY